MNNKTIKKLLSSTEYKTFILIGKGINKQDIAIKLNVTRETINSYFWHIRQTLEQANLIEKRGYGEKKNYNYLIDFAKSEVE